MNIQSPIKDKANHKVKDINDNLTTSLKSISDLKEDWMKMQRFEDVAMLGEIEKRVEKTIIDLNEL